MDTSRHARRERRKIQRFPPNNRLFVILNREVIRVANISTGGICIHGPALKRGTTVRLDLHLGKQHLSVPLEILDISDDAYSHGRFIELTDEDELHLQSYISEIQNK